MTRRFLLNVYVNNKLIIFVKDLNVNLRLEIRQQNVVEFLTHGISIKRLELGI